MRIGKYMFYIALSITMQELTDLFGNSKRKRLLLLVTLPKISVRIIYRTLDPTFHTLK